MADDPNNGGVDFVEYDETFIEDRLSRVLPIFQDKENYLKLLTIVYERMSDFNKLLIDYAKGTTLQNAIGAQLDEIGLRLGVRRTTDNDDDYRTRIRLAAVGQSSTVVRDSIVEIIETYTGDTQPYIYRRVPHYVDVMINVDCLPDGSTLDFLAQFFPLNTNLRLIRHEGRFFAFENNTRSGAGGFGSVYIPQEIEQRAGLLASLDYDNTEDRGLQ